MSALPGLEQPAVAGSPLNGAAETAGGLAGAGRTALTWQVGLAAVLLLALGLRFWSVGWQLPWQFHPDEGHYVWKAADMARDGNLNPKYFRNPSLYTYLLLAEYKLLEATGPLLTLAGAFWELLQPSSLYVLLGRLTSALLGAGTVALLYPLGGQLFGRAAGLLGALFLAVSLIHVRESHFATNDASATFLLVASVLCSALLARTGRVRYLLLAGLAGGLATSTKYNVGLFVVPLLVAYGQAYGRSGLATRRLGLLALAGLVALLAYLAGTPFTLLAWPTFRDDFLVQQRFARQGWEGQGPEPVGLLYLDALANGLGWPVFGLSLVGLAFAALRRRRALLLAIAFPLAYLGFMFGVRLFFVRFATPLAPFLCLFAAFGVVELGRVDVSRFGFLVSRGPGGCSPRGAGHVVSAVVAGLAVLATLPPLASSVRHNQILAQPDTRRLAFEWLAGNLPAQSRIVAEDYSVRDRRPRSDLPDRALFDLDQVNALSEEGLDHYRAQGYRYAVISSFQYQRFAGRDDTYAALEGQARLLAKFAPTDDGRVLPFDIEELYAPFHQLERYARPGPTIEIYDLGAGR